MTVSVVVLVVERDAAEARWVVRKYGAAGVFYDGTGYVITGGGFNLETMGVMLAADEAEDDG